MSKFVVLNFVCACCCCCCVTFDRSSIHCSLLSSLSSSTSSLILCQLDVFSLLRSNCANTMKFWSCYLTQVNRACVGIFRCTSGGLVLINKFDWSFGRQGVGNISNKLNKNLIEFQTHATSRGGGLNSSSSNFSNEQFGSENIFHSFKININPDKLILTLFNQLSAQID